MINAALHAFAAMQREFNVPTQEEIMPCTKQDDAARDYDPHMAATPGRGPGGSEAPRPQSAATQDSPVPASLVADESAGRSKWVFNRLVGGGLTILVVLLAAVMLNAGINVEVLL